MLGVRWTLWSAPFGIPERVEIKREGGFTMKPIHIIRLTNFLVKEKIETFTTK